MTELDKTEDEKVLYDLALLKFRVDYCVKDFKGLITSYMVDRAGYAEPIQKLIYELELLKKEYSK